MSFEYQDQLDLYDFESLEMIEYLERRERLLPEERPNDLDRLDDEDFRRRYRLNKNTVESILQKCSAHLVSTTSKNMALTPQEKLCSALRFFASGSHQIIIGDLGFSSQSSTCRSINEVANCLARLKPEYIRLPRTESERRQISHSFFEKSGFPGIYGALDCTHIPIISPGGPLAEKFRCRKGHFSINVQTLSDNDLYIRNIVARWPGSTHDSTIFDNSRLRAMFETSEIPSNYYLIGDNGYPLRPYLLTPFLMPLTSGQKRYNTAHVLARNAVERQYGVWKRRFACLGSNMRCDLQNSLTIIIATAVLHNIALSSGDVYDIPDIFDEEDDTKPLIETNSAGIARRNDIVNTHFTV